MIGTGRIRKVKRRAEKGEIIVSVYFHDPSSELFESSVKWFLKNKFRFISIHELHEILRDKKPFPSSAVLFTVDDGWKNNKKNIVPIANKYKVPVTIFATTNPVQNGEPYWWSVVEQANRKGLTDKRPLDVKQLKDDERIAFVEKLKLKISIPREALTVEELQEIDKTPYVNIECHTVTHPILSRCTDEKSAFEIVESKRILEQWLGRKVTHFAYPNGNYSEREVRILKEAGYDIAFSTSPKYITRETVSNIYTVPRFDVLEDISFTENICRMTGIWFNRRSSDNPKS
jgi:peptidoglycan/xylan/chitin deacetylase (PgdA/CDA1 family)